MSNYVAADDRSLFDRLWSRLGFGERSVPIPEDLEGFAPSYMISRVVVHVDLGDRLRALVSGVVVVNVQSKTDVAVKRAVTRSTFSVLPPGAA